MSRLLSRQSSGTAESALLRESGVQVGRAEILTDAAEVGAVEQAGVTVVRGLPSPDLVDLVVRAASVVRDQPLQPRLPGLRA